MPESSTEEPRIDVLFLEDDSVTVDAMKQLLSHCGCSVRHSSTILDAMPLLREPPQIAVLDLMLPDGSGTRILEIIRSRRLKTRVAILTACREREKLVPVVKLKPDLILSKPVDFIRLLQFINETRRDLDAQGGQPMSISTEAPSAAAA